jgi:hypothetical protein
MILYAVLEIILKGNALSDLSHHIGIILKYRKKLRKISFRIARIQLNVKSDSVRVLVR